MGTIKRAVVKVARPIWRRVGPRAYARIDKRIDLRLIELDAGWKQHVPAFLNAVSTVKAFGRELYDLRRSTQAAHAEIAELRQTIEQLRAALETNAAAAATDPASSTAPAPMPAERVESASAHAHALDAMEREGAEVSFVRVGGAQQRVDGATWNHDDSRDDSRDSAHARAD